MWSLTEFDEEYYYELLRKECYEKGFAVGKAKSEAREKIIGTIEILVSLVKDGYISEADAAEYANTAIYTNIRKVDDKLKEAGMSW